MITKQIFIEQLDSIVTECAEPVMFGSKSQDTTIIEESDHIIFSNSNFADDVLFSKSLSIEDLKNAINEMFK